MTVRLDAKTKQSLEKIASHERRSKSYLASQAITDYVAFQEAQVEGIKKAIESANAGKGVSHDKVKAWVASWGTGNELPMPKV